MTADREITPPRARSDFIGSPGLEAQLVKTLNAGALANGWLIVGGEGAGKATLAYRLARALLDQGANAGRSKPLSALDVAPSSRTHALVASGGHPDLFVAERRYDEKKERHATEISVETVRELSHFLSHTASMGGWRVGIIDTADDLNRNSANALLKILEEPPPRSALFVLTAAPGRLLATIRSRCRRIDLRPAPADLIDAFLARETTGDADERRRIVAESAGRPGYALSLALGDGGEAIEAVEAFLQSAQASGDAGAIAQRLALRNADGVWPLFRAMLISRLGDAARSASIEGRGDALDLVELRASVETLFARGDAVNLDRAQIVMAIARAIQAGVQRNGEMPTGRAG